MRRQLPLPPLEAGDDTTEPPLPLLAAGYLTVLLVDTELGIAAGEDLTVGSGAAGEGLGSKASPVKPPM